VADYLEGICPQQLGDHRARNVNSLPPEAGVAHGNDSGTHQNDCKGSL
jgi:hypothetical protein